MPGQDVGEGRIVMPNSLPTTFDKVRPEGRI